MFDQTLGGCVVFAVGTCVSSRQPILLTVYVKQFRFFVCCGISPLSYTRSCLTISEYHEVLSKEIVSLKCLSVVCRLNIVNI